MLKQPMLAASEIPCLETQVNYPCFIQPKLDGIRCVAINGQAFSRKMKLIPNKYIQKVFSSLNLHGLDGELMVYGDFNAVQSAIMSEEGEPNFYLMVYDYWDSQLPYGQRLQKATEEVFSTSGRYLQIIKNEEVHSAEETEEKLNKLIQEGFEGAILRSLDGPYKQNRSTFKEGFLLKLKKFMDDEAVVTGFEERMQNNNRKELDERGYSKRSTKKEGMVGADTLGSLLVKWGDIDFSVGSGFTDAQRKEIWENKDKYLGKLLTFKYQELSKYGVPRFPTFKGWRPEYEETLGNS